MLVGHDWGGAIAFKAAIDQPHRFTHLAILDSPCTVMSPSIPHPYWFKVAPLPAWMDAASLEHYIESFDAGSVFAAIQYYRYAMPLHRVIPDAAAPGGERYQLLSDNDIASMWLHPDGFEAHPWQDEYHDFAPEDRLSRFDGPATVIY